MIEENNEVRYLPVLRMVPKWKMRIRVPGKSRKLYYLPEEDRYVDSTHVSYAMVNIGKTPQEHYDRWYLNITVPSERPRNSNGETCRFRDYCFGYAKEQPQVSIPLSFNEWLENWIKSREAITPNVSRGQINRYKDPKEREKTGAASRRSWATSPNMVNCFTTRRGIRSKAFSPWENKEVSLDSSWESYFFEFCIMLGVKEVVRAPFRIKYYGEFNESDTPNNYIPDFILDGRYLIEIKPNHELVDLNIVFKAMSAISFCEEYGFEYVVITENFLFWEGNPVYGDLPFRIPYRNKEDSDEIYKLQVDKIRDIYLQISSE